MPKPQPADKFAVFVGVMPSGSNVPPNAFLFDDPFKAASAAKAIEVLPQAVRTLLAAWDASIGAVNSAQKEMSYDEAAAVSLSIHQLRIVLRQLPLEMESNYDK